MTGGPSSLAEKMLGLHAALERAHLAHAFGGALALAWCTQQARGTIDLDVNVFVVVEEAVRLRGSMPEGVVWTDADHRLLERDGQVRVWWGATPVDLFLNTTAFHEEAATRVRWEPFSGAELPFLACQDLAVFKAFFNRTKDWADLEAMAEAGTLDAEAVVGVLASHLGGGDERITRLLALAPPL